jgi:hypothetical protein
MAMAIFYFVGMSSVSRGTAAVDMLRNGQTVLPTASGMEMEREKMQGDTPAIVQSLLVVL